MFIDVSEIRKAPGQAFHFDLVDHIQSMAVGNDEIHFREPLKISLDVKNTGRILVFAGKITGDTELVCSRCLENYPFHLEAGFTEEFCHASDMAYVAEDGVETDIHVFEGNRINIDALISESVLLEIPMKSLCSENCKGLCAICGSNLNKNRCECKDESIDPRLAGLKKFFDV